MYLFNQDSEALMQEAQFAFQNVQLFRELYDQSQFSFEAVSPQLKELPMTQKSHYRKYYPKGIISDSESHTHDEIVKINSSGTDGDRLTSLHRQFELAERMYNCMEMNSLFAHVLSVPRVITCRYAAPNCSDVECANPNSTMQDRILPDNTLVLPVYHDFMSTPAEMLEQAKSEIESYEPNLLYVDPFHFSNLLFYIEHAGLTPLKLQENVGIVLSYNLTAEHNRKHIARYFNDKVPVASVMAMSEFGYVGMECEHGTMHLNTENFFFEFVNKQGEPASYGEIGELVISTLGECYSPKLRYQTGDLYYLKEQPCSCNRVDAGVIPLGRIKYSLPDEANEYLTPWMLQDRLAIFEFIQFFQCTIGRSGRRVQMQFIPSRDYSETDLNAVKATLESLFLGRKISVEVTDYLPAERSGKFSVLIQR